MIRKTSDYFHFRHFESSTRAAMPRFDHDADMYACHPSPGVPESLGPIHRNLYTSGFPYARSVYSDGTCSVESRPIVTLENDAARISILPWIGGRVMEFYHKGQARQLLWTPPSLKFANFGLGGAWTIGGIEFNAFRYGHNVFGNSTIAMRYVRLADGSDAVLMDAFDERFSASWQVVLLLDGDTLVARMTLKNWSTKPQPCKYWWTCIATPNRWRDQVLLAPGDFLHHTMFRQGYHFDQWPIVHGYDWSKWLHQHEVMSGYLANTNSDFMGYRREDDGDGFFHRADRNVCQGRKLWSLGSQEVHSSFWQTLAEPGWAPYAEIQSGLLPVQPDTGFLEPGEEISWTELYGAFDAVAESPDYAKTFAAFEALCEHKTASHWALWNNPDFWLHKNLEVLSEEDDRLAASRQVVSGRSLNEHLLQQTVNSGWVAGEGWVERLKSISKRTAEENLALAAAAIEVNNFALAQESLYAVPDTAIATIRAQAELLRALIEEQFGRTQQCGALLVSAGHLDPEEVSLFAAADASCVRQGLHEFRRELWNEASPSVTASDVGRYALASTSLLDGDYLKTRELLKGPLFSIAEGGTGPWLVFKESFFVEFMQMWSEGDFSTAIDALARGSMPCPQFGVGRHEARENIDFLFYRFLAARHAGWDNMAAALAEHILLDPVYTGSADEIYALRVAEIQNHPSKQHRLTVAREWSENAGVEWRSTQLLRAALWGDYEGQPEPWQRLCNHHVYYHRAAFEQMFHSKTLSATQQRYDHLHNFALP